MTNPLLWLKQKLLLRTRWKNFRRWLAMARYGRDPLLNLLLDLRYGGWCGRTVETPFSTAGAYNTQSVEYHQLAWLEQMGALQLRPGDVFVEIGCGKGRVFNWLLHRRYANRLIGIELDPVISSRTRQRLRSHAQVSIVTGDALVHLPADGSLFFLYNPFNEEITRRFKHRLEEARPANGQFRLVYLNAKHLAVFDNDPRWIVERIPSERHLPTAIIRPQSTC